MGRSGRPALVAALLAICFAQGADAGAPAAFASPDQGTRSSAPILGVDVSRFEGRIDWERAAGAGVGFAFIQASRGDGSDCTVKPQRCGRDRHFDTNYRDARLAGVLVGAYHRAFVGGASFGEARHDARREAAVFANEVGSLHGGDLLPVLDVETPFADLTPRRLRFWLRTWLAETETRLGVRPMIYTNVSSWSATGDEGAFARDGYRLWVANWGVTSPAVPARNWAGQSWDVWQYTNAGHVPGIEGATGLDRLRVPLGAITVAAQAETAAPPRRGSPAPRMTPSESRATA